MKTLLWILLFNLLGASLFASDTIIVDAPYYLLDHNKQLIVCNLESNSINSQWSGEKSHISLDRVYSFSNPVDTVVIGTEYKVRFLNDHYLLYFTQLPLLKLEVSQDIPDEPKVPGYMVLSSPTHTLVESHIGIEIRGGWTQGLPKVSYGIECWEDTTGNETKKMSLLNMREDDDWNLQAMYNEPLRLRNKSGHAIWKTMHQLSYQGLEPTAANGITMQYAECSINGVYKGVYAIGEKVDRKQLQLKKHDGQIRGALYKGFSWGNTTFGNVSNFDNNKDIWDAFEYIHPEEEIDWEPLYDFIDLVVNDSNEKFFEKYTNHFELDNAVDYFIFLNLLRASDNTGKNTYIARYDSDTRFFYIPWDLDGIFGVKWDGENGNYPTGILMNGFYERLIYDCYNTVFTDRLKDRWAELREGPLSETALLEILASNYDYLVRNAVYTRESIAWPDYEDNASWRWDYTETFLHKRIEHLDEVFAELCDSIPIIDTTLQTNFIVFPNPSNGIIHIQIENTTVVDELIVYNSTGHKVYETNNFDRLTLEIDYLVPGVYFLHFRTGDYVQVEKIVVNNY